MAVTAVDYDNDGRTDLFVTGYQGNVLYRSFGQCKFQDVTDKAGLRGGGFSTGAAWADYDRDGDLDLFVARYVLIDLSNLPEFGSSPSCSFRGIRVQCGPRGLPGETDLLYSNSGNGTFEEVSHKAGVGDTKKFYGLGPIWGDYDNDGWLDLFVANDSTPNYLYHNKKNGTFTEVGRGLVMASRAPSRVQWASHGAISTLTADWTSLSPISKMSLMPFIRIWGRRASLT